MTDFALENPQLVVVPEPKPMTHRECVEAAYSYTSRRHDIALPEFFCWNNELADVIGFKNKYTTLVECKISRADFFRDKKKGFRRMPEFGMGNYRFYCCPKGLIQPYEVPDDWGLLYIYPSGHVRQVKSARYFNDKEKNKVSENHILFYYARRAVVGGFHEAILKVRT